MTARLFSRTGDTRNLTLELEAGGEAIVGRDPASDLAIEQPLMSGRHARIFYDAGAGRFAIEDLDSLNGTELDGDRVTGKEPLGHLNVITFAGSYEFFFIDTERVAQRHLEPVAARPPAEVVPVEPVPAVAAAAADAPAGGKLGGGDSEEVTAVDVEPFSMPDFLARRADALRDSAEADSERPSTPSELTSIEREPIALPGFLARRADEASAEAPEAPAEDVPMEDTPAGETADSGKAKREKTMHEKLPVALPGNLARRVEELAGGEHHPDVQKHETVDLAQIEKLIAEEEAAERDEREAGLQLIVTASGGRVRRYPLATGENLVGRGANAKVVLKYPDLSRRHALITVAGDQITLRDLGSRNRTFVNDSPVEPEVDVAVEPGARLRFGSVEARLRKVEGSPP